MPIGSLSEDEELNLRKGKAYDVGKQGRVLIHLDSVTSVPIVTMEGRIHGGEAVTVAETLRGDLDKVPGYVIMDMLNLEYTSSTMLGFIAQLALDRHESGHDLFMCNVGQRVRWLLTVLDMDDFFHFRSSLEDAVSDALICKVSAAPQHQNQKEQP